MFLKLLIVLKLLRRQLWFDTPFHETLPGPHCKGVLTRKTPLVLRLIRMRVRLLRQSLGLPWDPGSRGQRQGCDEIRSMSARSGQRWGFRGSTRTTRRRYSHAWLRPMRSPTSSSFPACRQRLASTRWIPSRSTKTTAILRSWPSTTSTTRATTGSRVRPTTTSGGTRPSVWGARVHYEQPPQELISPTGVRPPKV